MEDSKMKRDSRIRKTLSWIAGTDRATRRITKPSPTARSKRPESLLSFLPSILDNGPVEYSYQNSTPLSPTEGPPAPFFHSRPLPRTPEIKHNSFADQTADSSLCSLTSDEIARWKMYKPLPNTRRPHGRFGFLKSLLHLDKMKPITSAGPQEEDSTLISSDSSMDVEYPRQASSFPVLQDHPFDTPAFTCASRSFRRPLAINSLSPPPRPKRASINPTNPPVTPKANSRVRSLPGIDPAKWAEISISAADLVRQYGHKKVIFGAALECHSDDSLEKELGLGDLSFVEMEDACGPLQSSSYTGGKILQSKSHDVDLSVTTSSMAGSMTSLSKWPLPPQCEKFEPTSAVLGPFIGQISL